MRGSLAAVIVALAGSPAIAHRLDQYLQGAIVSLEKSRVDVQMTLTPGVSIFPQLIADIDTDANGVISEAEQRAYAGRVLQDLSLTIDGHRLTPQLLSMQFPAIEEMKAGRGEIQLEFDADLPRGGPNRKLTFENRHQSRIAAYQVNCLVSRDPDIKIAGQVRNYTQSVYELDYVQTGVRSGALSVAWWPDDSGWLLTTVVVFLAGLAFLWRHRARSGYHANACASRCKPSANMS